MFLGMDQVRVTPKGVFLCVLTTFKGRRAWGAASVFPQRPQDCYPSPTSAQPTAQAHSNSYAWKAFSDKRYCETCSTFNRPPPVGLYVALKCAESQIKFTFQMYRALLVLFSPGTEYSLTYVSFTSLRDTNIPTILKYTLNACTCSN